MTRVQSIARTRADLAGMRAALLGEVERRRLERLTDAQLTAAIDDVERLLAADAADAVAMLKEVK